ncbi:unnamed protein product [Ectocarpus sp. CCAP 1310/34]|nr:unnamed protein product [Ectocarpus sp. CCAP 1310/34]
MSTQNTDRVNIATPDSRVFVVCNWEEIQEIPRTEVAQWQEVDDSCSSPTTHDASAKQL